MSPLPHVSGTDPSVCVFDTFRTAIAACVANALPQLTIEQAYAAIDYGKKGIDFTIALFQLRLPHKPDELAHRVIDSFQPDEWIESISHDKVFLHFQLRTETLIRTVLTQVHDLMHATASGQPEYGHNRSGMGQQVIVEFSSPNVAKEFHVGHLRSTVIGAVLVNVYKASGWKTISMNYLGDWGTQFGVVAIGFERYGSEDELSMNPIKHLSQVYVKASLDCRRDPAVKAAASAYFKRMEEGDESTLENWRVWRQLSLTNYLEAYKRLNVSFDVQTGESMVERHWQLKVLDGLRTRGLLNDYQGADSVDLREWGLEYALLRKSNGTSTYLLRDLAGAVKRYKEYRFDRMLYVIASSQDHHSRQLFKILELLELPWASTLQHVSFGIILGMSTRNGTSVFLDDIIEQATQVMHQQMMKNEEKYHAIEDPENTSAQVGISAVKIQDLTAKRRYNYEFNWERMTSFEGDTGPYLQYAHVRLASLSRKNPDLLPISPSAIDISDLTTSARVRNIVFLLGSYPDVIRTALKTHEPSGIVTFAFKLSHAISSAWETVVVKGEADVEKARARLWLYRCTQSVLGAALRMLTIEPLEKM